MSGFHNRRITIQEVYNKRAKAFRVIKNINNSFKQEQVKCMFTAKQDVIKPDDDNKFQQYKSWFIKKQVKKEGAKISKEQWTNKGDLKNYVIDSLSEEYE